ncbi:hypothetical protein [Tellurirhabdus rosea]|uniref:hypothetical protein n=1 Tax=Tellurirhabdus rosea TaxID=2674997 RepID=UPI0022543229|nr:hypothetical protein [Tellurirhabdus rosea]
MKTTKLIGTVLGCLLALISRGQTEAPRAYRNFPLVVTLQFHSLSLPFRDLKTNFTNVGLGLGTEVSLNGRHNWAQQFNVVWYRNKVVGNGVLAYTQTAWRPALFSNIYTEVKAGAGYLMSFRPVESYKSVEGEWVSVGHKGKGMLAVPVGISIGYNNPNSRTPFSPFASYQMVLVNGYNQSIPLVPQTLIQVGSRIHFH